MGLFSRKTDREILAEARALYKKGDLAGADLKAMRLARKGNPEACWLAGQINLEQAKRKNSEMHRKAAYLFLERAAAQGHAQAETLLAQAFGKPSPAQAAPAAEKKPAPPAPAAEEKPAAPTPAAEEKPAAPAPAAEEQPAEAPAAAGPDQELVAAAERGDDAAMYRLAQYYHQQGDLTQAKYWLDRRAGRA